ncbi:MAG: glutamate--tRNA ligase [Planctomycetes bacterium]|nr:glutamate--tRNA ligase [Planctomycetota bacterium]
MNDPVRTRFAPSPSGHLHVGGARTALFCWAYARSRDGRFLLRIEDTDRKRSSDAAALGFLADLAWLGIDWNEGPEHDGCGGGDRGPYFQSQRREIYDGQIERLLASGAAYHTDDEEPAVRLRVPDAPIVFHDEVVGEVVTSPEQVDDFVIRKSDGFPTYHFAVVVDDELMGVTHVIRAQEHLSNTPKHVLLQDALGFAKPTYAHVSIIVGADGSKMSKREKDRALRKTVREREVASSPVVDDETWAWWLESKDHQLELHAAERLAADLGIDLPEIDVHDFRRAGFLPEVMVNYLALLGWSPGGDREQFDVAFLLEHFDLDRLIKSPARFDRDKLLSFNLDAIKAMSADEFAERLLQYATDFHGDFLDVFNDRYPGDAFAHFARQNQARSKTLADPIRDGRFFVIDDDEIEYQQSKAVRKALVKGDPNGYAHMEAIRPVLEALPEWTVPAIETAIEQYAEQHAAGRLGSVAQPLRVAVSGGPVSPAIHDTLALLGRQRVLARIDRCLARREELSSA